MVDAGVLTQDGSLLERDDALERLESALARVVERGSGACVAVEGPPGIGKTRVISELARRAEGVQLLTARAGELERDYAFGVARQLFERPVASAAPRERANLLDGPARVAAAVVGADAPSPADDRFQLFHGLYWLVSNLVAQQPAVLLVDDAHWADGASLEWLRFLGRRLADVPVLLVLALRPFEPGTAAREVDAVLVDAAADVIRLEPLSQSAVSALVDARLGPGVPDEVRRACHLATRGNPFYVRELLGELARLGGPLTAADAGRVVELASGDVTRNVLHRIRRLPAPAIELAQALAVLGGRAPLRTVATVAGLDDDSAASAADGLRAIDILTPDAPPEFVHAIVRAAVYGSMPVAARAEAHRRAADALARVGADREAVALQLLATRPGADAWVVEQLRRAATDALSGGRAAAAVAYLRRALEEVPPVAERPALLARLGSALLRDGGGAEAIGPYREALDGTSEPRLRALTTRGLARALLLAGRPVEGIELLGRAIDELGDAEHDLALRLDADLRVIGYASLDARRAATARPSPPLPAPGEAVGRGERLALAAQALETVFAGTASDAARLAERALAGGLLLAEESADSPTFYLAANTLFDADRLDAAFEVYSDAMADAVARGSSRGFAIASSWRAGVQLKRGAVHDAEADARQSLDATGPGVDLARPVALAFLVHALVARGALEEAERELAANRMSGTIPATVLAPFLLFARAELRLARGQLAAAREDLSECGRLEDAWGIGSPALTSWRTLAVRVAIALGESEEATRLAHEEQERAHAFGVPRALGLAQVAAALAEPDGARVLALREAVETLASSPARLDHARALLELGAALRHTGQPVEAREPLRAAVDHARACGAVAVAASAHDELTATGVRPRKLLEGGEQALTASERRVARMAADGMSNREIAASLFVTVKTVEVHLGRAYRKLGIAGRGDLAAALRADG